MFERERRSRERYNESVSRRIPLLKGLFFKDDDK
jgi:hypothetical protein